MSVNNRCVSNDYECLVVSTSLRSLFCILDSSLELYKINVSVVACFSKFDLRYLFFLVMLPVSNVCIIMIPVVHLSSSFRKVIFFLTFSSQSHHNLFSS